MLAHRDNVFATEFADHVHHKHRRRATFANFQPESAGLRTKSILYLILAFASVGYTFSSLYFSIRGYTGLLGQGDLYTQLVANWN